MYRYLILVLASVFFSHLANAQTGPYGEVRGGVAFLDDADLDDGSGIDIVSTFDAGYLIAGAGGYAHGSGFRGELELAYRENGNDELEFRLPGPDVTFDAEGDTSAFTAMANGYYDIDIGVPALRPYVGFGVGLAVVDTELSVQGIKLVDDSDTVFAYQALAGAAFHITPNIATTVGYAYLATTDPKFKVEGGGSVDAEYASHNVMVGLRYTF
jgi:opacity protein-like surface antigen